MPEFHSDSLVPPKHGVISPFAMLTWFSIVMVFIGVIAMFALKFDFSRLRGSDHFIGKAREAISAKDWPAAVEALRHVNGKDQDKPGYLRVVADFLEGARVEPALLDSTLDKLEAKGLMQAADYLWRSRMRLAVGNVAASRRALESIPSAKRESVEYMRLNIEILKEEGRMREAKMEEHRMAQMFPGNPEVVLLQASADLQASFPELQTAAMGKLWKLAGEKNEYGQKAIVLLSKSKLTLSEANRLLELADKSGIGTAERLQIVSTILRLDPEQREVILKKAIDQYRQGGAQAAVQLALWLAQEKEHRRAMELVMSAPAVSKEALMRSPEVFTMTIQGLAAESRWKEMLALIPKGKKLPVANALACTWRALATSHLNPSDALEPRAHLEEAFREAKISKDVFVLNLVARMAEEGNMSDLAFQAYQFLAAPEFGREFEMMDKSWKMAEILKDSGQLLRVAERLVSLRPANQILAQRCDYLRLLRGEQIEITLSTTAKNYQEGNPSDVYELLCALKAYRLNDKAQVAANLSRIKTLEGFTLGERAVCAGLLASQGDQIHAFPIAEKVQSQALLPEEELLMKGAF